MKHPQVIILKFFTFIDTLRDYKIKIDFKLLKGLFSYLKKFQAFPLCFLPPHPLQLVKCAGMSTRQNRESPELQS